uniref:Uncharacterized protein n=1 Tax=Arundo donax TaxID=35708 RepID=A0A0A9B7G3_ARUDO
MTATALTRSSMQVTQRVPFISPSSQYGHCSTSWGAGTKSAHPAAGS